MLESLIYDWNKIGAPASAVVMLEDETMRDGLQSTSGGAAIAEKIAILHGSTSLHRHRRHRRRRRPNVVVDVRRLARRDRRPS